MIWPIESEIIAMAIAHARREFPKESCGLVVEKRYVEITNVSPEPEKQFIMARNEYLPFYASGKIRAVIHSHSDGTAFPSKEDMANQQATGFPFGIVTMTSRDVVKEVFFFGDQIPVRPPYIGRPFRHGVTDCYELVRDWYLREGGIRLPFVPRDPEWWNTAQNVLLDGFAGMGFHEIDFKQIKRGDGVLFNILPTSPQGARVNHCGVYTGNGKVLHHLFGTDTRIRYSREDNIYAWRNSIAKILRYKDGFPVRLSK